MQLQMREKTLPEPPRPHYRGPGFQPGYGHQPTKPYNDQAKVPNTLAPQNLVNDDLFWYEKCQVYHPESCPLDQQEGASTSNVNFAQELVTDEGPSYSRTYHIPQKTYQEVVSHSVRKEGLGKVENLEHMINQGQMK